MLALQGKLVSRHKSEYAGPCLFKGIGDDRFHVWAGANNWWCRKDCPAGGRRGWFGNGETRDLKVLPRARNGTQINADSR